MVVAAIHTAIQFIMCTASNVNALINIIKTAVLVALWNIQTSQPNRSTHTNRLYAVWLPVVCMVPVLMHRIHNTRHAQHIQQHRVVCEIMITCWLLILLCQLLLRSRKAKHGCLSKGTNCSECDLGVDQNKDGATQ